MLPLRHRVSLTGDKVSLADIEPFLKEQPENYLLIGELALTNMGLGDKAAALALP
jgi:hypothetical protein